MVAGGEAKAAAVKLPAVRIDRLVFGSSGTHLVAAWSNSSLFLLDVNQALAFTQLTDPHATDFIAISTRYAAAFDSARQALRVWEDCRWSRARLARCGASQRPNI